MDYARIPRYQEAFWCGAIPTLFKMIQYMSSKSLNAEFTLKFILTYNIKAFNESLKRRFQNYGVWSTSEAERRFLIEGPGALDVGDARNMCRGVNLTFLRVAYHVFKDFGCMKASVLEKLQNKVYITQAQRNELPLDLSDDCTKFFPLDHACFL